MTLTIQKRIRFSAIVIMIIFLCACFFSMLYCVRVLYERFREDVASSAVSFASLTIDADNAKDYLTMRTTDSAYISVLQCLKQYQEQNSTAVKRISLVSFSSTTGNYIYDTDQCKLGERLEYDDYTDSVRAELINGRNSWNIETGDSCFYYVPHRTSDDRLAGYLIIELNNHYKRRYFPVLAGTAGVLLLTGIVLVFLLMQRMREKVFKPIQKFTEATGKFTAEEGEEITRELFRVSGTDEISELGKAIGKMFTDLSSGAESLSKALYEANHDGMTQVLNKRCYTAMEESFRHCNSICIIYFDVNNLKLMNDTLGHEKGDYVIKKASEYIRGIMTNSDYCFRMGGDEFMMVMTECSFRSIDALIEKLDGDEPHILSQTGDSVKCALSYGYAYAKGQYSYEALLAEAEENMYHKKTELKKLMNMPDR